MQNLVVSGKKIINTEIKALQLLECNLDKNFSKACELINSCVGKVVVMGMGKSGHIGKKIAATFASTGTPSFFIHPGEAGHGDLGMIESDDIVIYISYSGTSSEITAIMSIIARNGNKTIAITGKQDGIISTQSDIWLNASVESEACPHNLAPTSSTTTALVLGDCLAMVVLQLKGFSTEDFARSHPAGALGKKLLTSVSDIMQNGDDLPIIIDDTPLLQSLALMSEKKLGLLIIASKNQELLGVFTDGDLRRVLAGNEREESIFAIMTKNPRFIASDKPAILALEIMEKFNINSLPVVDNKKIVGAINMHTLIQAKIV